MMGRSRHLDGCVQLIFIPTVNPSLIHTVIRPKLQHILPLLHVTRIVNRIYTYQNESELEGQI